jgi:hypothetical protein
MSPPEENRQSDPEEVTWDPSGSAKRRKLTGPGFEQLTTYTSFEQIITYTPATSDQHTPSLPERDGMPPSQPRAKAHSGKVKTGEVFDVWYQSCIAPLDRGEDWHINPAYTLTTDHRGPQHHFKKIWIDRRTGHPAPGQQQVNSQTEFTKM